MKPKVLVTQVLPQKVEDYLREHTEIIKVQLLSETNLVEALNEVEGILTSGLTIDNDLLDKAPNLKVVSNQSVGYNNFDLDAMNKRNIVGTHTPNVLDDTVADLVLSLMLASARRIPEMDRLVKEGNWLKNIGEELFGVDVHHATIGIIGMGRIGEAIAKRAIYGFDMKALYYNRTRKTEAENRLGVVYAEMDQLLQQSDFVVLMTPLTKGTEKFFGEKQFTLMKQSAIFINASRGATVDEEALIQALQTGGISGAGLDVFTIEPIDLNNPLLKMEQVVTLPHIGSATLKTRHDMAELAAKNLVIALSGEHCPCVVKELAK
ncbi:2-hydroxyacid dehydrogenase [Bacillus solitudinis]|uniref:2-hydroxyacid dehydrogenase n=1 Tax=Bacillus solitudinis TaxID=2014074 RepID=UPI000C2348D1|nr:D-glycerate dehydrogenase [Bacillus solitudinis]